MFIHGGGPSGRMWRDHLERLAARFQCLAPDLPGFSHSHHLGPLSLDESADLLAVIRRAARTWVDIDLLLTEPTISDALTKTRERRSGSGV